MGFKIKEVGISHYARIAGNPVFEEVFFNMIKPRIVFDLLKDIKKLWLEIHRKSR